MSLNSPSPSQLSFLDVNSKDLSPYSTNNLFITSTASLPNENTEGDEEPNLAPIDGGKAAWMFLLGAVVIDAVVWGFPLNFGVFQDYYTTHEPFLNNQYIQLIGTFATGLPYLGGPLMTPLMIRFHSYRQLLVVFGCVLCILSTVAASFAKALWVLILFQGVLYGIGFLIISYAGFSMLNEWFDKKRGLAYGVLLSASGAAGMGIPFVLQILLKKYGYRTTLQIYALAIVVIASPAILLLRSRSRHLKTPPKNIKIDYSVLKKGIFSLLSMCNFLQGLVFYLPSIFLPSFASELSISPSSRSIILALLNLSGVFGLLIVGHFSDSVNIHLLLFITSLFSGITVYIGWGLSKTMLDLCIFAVLYGFSAGGFESLFPRFATALTEDPEEELTFYGLFEFQRGLGMVLAGPVSGALIGGVVNVGWYGLQKYESVILITGSALMIGSLAGAGWFVRGKSWYR